MKNNIPVSRDEYRKKYKNAENNIINKCNRISDEKIIEFINSCIVLAQNNGTEIAEISASTFVMRNLRRCGEIPNETFYYLCRIIYKRAKLISKKLGYKLTPQSALWHILDRAILFFAPGLWDTDFNIKII